MNKVNREELKERREAKINRRTEAEESKSKEKMERRKGLEES